MKTEEGWHMYTEINQLIKNGLKKSQIARKLSISRPTLDKYLAMTPMNLMNIYVEYRNVVKSLNHLRKIFYVG